MRRPLFTLLAGLVLTIGLAGCGGDPEMPEGYSEDDIRTPSEGTQMSTPGGDVEEPSKMGDG